MIVSFKHKGLERFFLKGDGSKLNPAHLPKIRRILAQLHAAQNVQDVNVPGWDLHPLKGNLKDHWSVKVNGNYRIVFIFVGERVEVLDVNYLDYH
ncbi:type II toxin-antitoxin system RelE/ParE family toxin [Pontibacter harenae]|uniref:type II toxin-antitoxin system RelE/ParE family toxin n=1 Tax=Pontibacter harenae TaxID=2894083 RepID=UPI001E53BA57|nr:type II toxin-antitoxin system RelE/ParE family toxin [Pontibacter harenae]MCC9167891.1 type II toxin-antitoxin system RelE/ParE family toxin [Pontibacter harenae]